VSMRAIVSDSIVVGLDFSGAGDMIVMEYGLELYFRSSAYLCMSKVSVAYLYNSFSP
jgi:hypothetical protein